MPNRIIKDSICTSDSINVLSDKAEILFYRLIVQCDDYGLFDGRASIIRTKCFPLKVDDVKEKDIEKWLTELSRAEMIQFYTIGGKRYLKMSAWANHQQLRARKSKYPQPLDDDINCNHMISDDINCRPEIESEIESESESEIESESESPRATTKYGKFNNVRLTDQQMTELQSTFSDWQDRIERLSEYMASKGKKYANHYATILSWAKKDEFPKRQSAAERIMNL